MSQLVACPLDRVIVRAAKHRAHGLSMPEISQKLGHSEEAIIQILEENPRLWQLELSRARRELLSEAVNQVVLKMSAVLLLEDEDKQFDASDRIIKVLFAQNKKKLRSASRPRPEFIHTTPAPKPLTPTPQAATAPPAEEISPLILRQAMEFQSLNDEQKQERQDKFFVDEFRRRRDRSQDMADRAAMKFFDEKTLTDWYAGKFNNISACEVLSLVLKKNPSEPIPNALKNEIPQATEATPVVKKVPFETLLNAPKNEILPETEAPIVIKPFDKKYTPEQIKAHEKYCRSIADFYFGPDEQPDDQFEQSRSPTVVPKRE